MAGSVSNIGSHLDKVANKEIDTWDYQWIFNVGIMEGSTIVQIQI
jgi:hypothetical protein